MDDDVTKRPQDDAMVRAMEWYEQSGGDNDEVISTFVRNGYLRMALGMMMMSHRRITVRSILESMEFSNHKNMLTCLKKVCPVIYKEASKPHLTLSGLCNTSIIPSPYNQDLYLLNVRVVNYRLNERAQFMLPQDQPFFHSRNLMLEIGHDLTTVLHEKWFENDEMDGIVSLPMHQKPYRGIEDVRLIQHDGAIHYIGTTLHGNRLMMTCSVYDPNLPRLPIRPIHSPTHRQVEKNWCMFEHRHNDDNRDIRFVYQWSPLEIGRIEDDRLVIVHQKNYGLWFMSRIKGSSTGVFDAQTQCLWFLVHFHSDDVPRQYYHMIIQMDPNDYEIVRMSRPFLFEDTTIQFGMGLLVEDDRIIMTYTVFDRDTRIVSYDRATLVRQLLADDHAVFIRG